MSSEEIYKTLERMNRKLNCILEVLDKLLEVQVIGVKETGKTIVPRRYKLKELIC